ncbi:MAG: 50S ribosomal protein L21 [Oscillospiraceae bacterium]|nr:50S ribosomal protein L21 [Oscillospiraceae bacterium]
MYAIIETGGKQFKVEQGDVIFTELLPDAVDAEVELKVIAIGDDGAIKLGKEVAKSKVTGKVVKRGKGKKIRVFTYKSKTNYSRRMGHRQPYTKIEITSIKA